MKKASAIMFISMASILLAGVAALSVLYKETPPFPANLIFIALISALAFVGTACLMKYGDKSEKIFFYIGFGLIMAFCTLYSFAMTYTCIYSLTDHYIRLTGIGVVNYVLNAIPFTLASLCLLLIARLCKNSKLCKGAVIVSSGALISPVIAVIANIHDMIKYSEDIYYYNMVRRIAVTNIITQLLIAFFVASVIVLALYLKKQIKPKLPPMAVPQGPLTVEQKLVFIGKQYQSGAIDFETYKELYEKITGIK